jgi:hypothetical protein
LWGVVSRLIMWAAMMTMQWNSLKMRRMTSTVYSLLECSASTTQHVAVLSRSVEPEVSTRW